MRRRVPEREAFAQALVQTVGYVVLTGIVIWLMLGLT